MLEAAKRLKIEFKSANVMKCIRNPEYNLIYPRTNFADEVKIFQTAISCLDFYKDADQINIFLLLKDI